MAQEDLQVLEVHSEAYSSSSYLHNQIVALLVVDLKFNIIFNDEMSKNDRNKPQHISPESAYVCKNTGN